MFFSKRINLVYRTSFSKIQKIRHGTAFQCYFCSNYYGRKDKFDRHIENCTGRPGFVYNFNIQSLLTSEENLKFKRDIPFTAYIDLKLLLQLMIALTQKIRKCLQRLTL